MGELHTGLGLGIPVLASMVYSEAVAGMVDHMVGLVAVGVDTVAAVVVESRGHFGAVAGREPVVLAAGTGGPEEVVVGCMAEVVQPDSECVVETVPLQEVLLHRESFEPFLCQSESRLPPEQHIYQLGR